MSHTTHNTHTTRILVADLPLSADVCARLHAHLVRGVITPTYPDALQNESSGSRSCVIRHRGTQADFAAIDHIVDEFHSLGVVFGIDDPRPIAATRRDPVARSVFPSAYAYRRDGSRC